MTEVVLENINAAYQEDENSQIDKTRGKTSLNMRYSVAANRAASSDIINTTIKTRTNGQVLKNYSCWVEISLKTGFFALFSGFSFFFNLKFESYSNRYFSDNFWHNRVNSSQQSIEST